MGTKNNPGNFDCYANAEPDEPQLHKLPGVSETFFMQLEEGGPMLTFHVVEQVWPRPGSPKPG